MHVKTVFILALAMVTGLASAAPAEDLPTGTTKIKNVIRAEANAQHTCTTYDYLGWIDMECDYNDGIGMHTGAHEKCATYCAKLGDGVPDCYDARCKHRADQHGAVGQCWCPCGVRMVCST